MKYIYLDSFIQSPLSNGILFCCGMSSDAKAAVKNTDNTNETNLKIAQLNNDFNERMYDKQEAYNREMYQKQYEDSTNYADKVAKLKAAGLNPALFFNQGASGTTSAMSVNPPSADDSGRQVPVDGSVFTSSTANLNNAFNSVSSAALGAAQTLADNTLKYSQANQVDQNAYFTPGMIRSQIYKNTQEGNKTKYEASSAKTKSLVDDASKDAVITSQFLNNDLLSANIDYTVQKTCSDKIESFLVQKNIDWFDRTKTQELAESAQRVALMQKQGQLTEEQAKTELYKRIELAASANQKQASANQINKMTDILYETASLDYDRKDEELNNLRKFGTTTPSSQYEYEGEGSVGAGIGNIGVNVRGKYKGTGYKRLGK